MTVEPVTVFKTKLDARVPHDAGAIGRAASDRPARSAARRPLGLAPVPEGDPERYGSDADDAYLGPKATAERIVAGSLANLSAEQRAAPATMADLFEYGISMALETGFEEREFVREKVRELKAEHAREIAGLTATVNELRIAMARLEGAASERAKPTILRP
jgi:hypothetical protein